MMKQCQWIEQTSIGTNINHWAMFVLNKGYTLWKREKDGTFDLYSNKSGMNSIVLSFACKSERKAKDIALDFIYLETQKDKDLMDETFSKLLKKWIVMKK